MMQGTRKRSGEGEGMVELASKKVKRKRKNGTSQINLCGDAAQYLEREEADGESARRYAAGDGNGNRDVEQDG
jgi:hypothetical protein